MCNKLPKPDASFDITGDESLIGLIKSYVVAKIHENIVNRDHWGIEWERYDSWDVSWCATGGDPVWQLAKSVCQSLRELLKTTFSAWGFEGDIVAFTFWDSEHDEYQIKVQFLFDRRRRTILGWKTLEWIEVVNRRRRLANKQDFSKQEQSDDVDVHG